jgi:hypothetical protein
MISAKGFINRAGENNCAINVIVQAFWQLYSFRADLLKNEEHKHNPTNCFFCALKNIFAQIKFGEDDILPTSSLREALSSQYQNESKFQLGKMEDAVETFEAALTLIHEAVSGSRDICSPPCFVHKIFSINYFEHVRFLRPLLFFVSLRDTHT